MLFKPITAHNYSLLPSISSTANSCDSLPEILRYASYLPPKASLGASLDILAFGRGLFLNTALAGVRVLGRRRQAFDMSSKFGSVPIKKQARTNTHTHTCTRTHALSVLIHRSQPRAPRPVRRGKQAYNTHGAGIYSSSSYPEHRRRSFPPGSVMHTCRAAACADAGDRKQRLRDRGI